MPHTKGPYLIDIPHTRKIDGPTIWSKDGMLIAQMAGLAEFDYDNARLFKAAPDLLAACKAAFERLKRDGDPFSGDDWELGHRLSAAIGLATDPNYPERI